MRRVGSCFHQSISRSAGRGGNDVDALTVTATKDEDSDQVRSFISSHFGYGIMTFSPGYLFRTSPGWATWVRGSPNESYSILQPLEGNDVESVWRIWAAPRLGDVRIADLNIYHGIDLRDHIAAESSTIRAASAIRVLRPMLSWAASEGYVPANPWLGLRAGQAAPARDRVLTEPEWLRLWDAAHHTPYPFGPWLQVLMLSGQRRSNVAQMTWSELEGGVWTIPASKMKATRPDRAKAHEVPLSDRLASIVAAQPRVCEFVFTSRDGKAIVPGSKLKARISEQAELSDWRWHDVRRTAATLMASRRVTRFVVERVLGHSDSSITAIYDRSGYRDEKRAALEVLAGTVPPLRMPEGIADA